VVIVSSCILSVVTELSDNFYSVIPKSYIFSVVISKFYIFYAVIQASCNLTLDIDKLASLLLVIIPSDN
jgi:hypothetical protein